MVYGNLTTNGLASEILKIQASLSDLYCFIAKIEPWPNEANVPAPLTTDSYVKSIHKNMIAMKKVNSNDISPVIERIDWTSGITYTQYSDSASLFEIDENKKLINHFYIKNSYDQVFKCLYNGNSNLYPTGIPSTYEPLVDFSFDPTFGYITTADGYKWKYLFSIDSGSKLKFFDDNWIPVPVTSIYSDIRKSTAGYGEISTINVYNKGSNYTNDSGVGISTTITIDGDGIGASAVAQITGNSVVQVLMSNTGSNYTYANVSIIPTIGFSGNGSVLTASVSPIGGHGFNLLQELGCRTILITSQFNGTESGTIPDNIDYREVGLISYPLTASGTADGFVYRLTHDVIVSPGGGIYTQDEFVYQGDSLATATFYGRVLNFDSSNNILYLINTNGSISSNDILKGDTSKVIRVAFQESVQPILPTSGDILYVENRSKVQRTTNGIEQFRLTLSY